MQTTVNLNFSSITKQLAIGKAIAAIELAEKKLHAGEMEAGFNWTAVADTWATIAAQLSDPIPMASDKTWITHDLS